MSKKYLVISNLYGEETTSVYDSHYKAVEYVNETTTALDDYVVEVAEVEDDYYRISFNNNVGFTMAIKDFAATKIKFHLARYDDDEYTETRRFSTHEKAVTFVDKVFDKYDFDADEYETETGEWYLVDEGNGLNIKFNLFVVILGDEPGSVYYDILGVNRRATKEEIKSAYRKKSKEHHPDLNGDEQKFKKINEAYNELMNDEFKKKSNNVVDIYPCANIKYILQTSFKKSIKRRGEGWRAAITEARNKAIIKIVAGAVELLSGSVILGLTEGGGSLFAKIFLLGSFFLILFGINEVFNGVRFAGRVFMAWLDGPPNQ